MQSKIRWSLIFSIVSVCIFLGWLPQAEALPHLELTSPIPDVTETVFLRIKGFAGDEFGVSRVLIQSRDGSINKEFNFDGHIREDFSRSFRLQPGENILTITAINTHGQRSKKVFSVRFKNPKDSSTSSSPSSHIEKLLTQADARFERQQFLLPEAQNAFTLYKEALQEEPGNKHARRKLYEIMEIYKGWGDEGRKQDADRYYKRYLIVAEFVEKTFGDEQVAVEIQQVRQLMQQAPSVARPSPTPENAKQPPEIEKPDTVVELAEISDDVLQRRGKVYGVVIGIGEYQDANIPRLRFAVNDARKFYELMTDPRYGGVPEEQMQLLLDGDATYRNVKTAIGKWLRHQANPDGMVVIFYSGHGAPEEGDTYWVTHDADVNNLFATALDNTDIADMLARIRAKRMVTFIDSCYSAATVKRKDRTRSVQTEIPLQAFSGEGRVAISASDGKQQSLEMEKFQHGVFTYYLLQGLRGKADSNRDGVIDLDETWDFVKFQVADAAQRAGIPQSPKMQGEHTAGIPLTFNMSFLQQQEAQQQLTSRKEQVTKLLREGKMSLPQFNKALDILERGDSDPILEGFLDGKISLERFHDTF